MNRSCFIAYAGIDGFYILLDKGILYIKYSRRTAVHFRILRKNLVFKRHVRYPTISCAEWYPSAVLFSLASLQAIKLHLLVAWHAYPEPIIYMYHIFTILILLSITPHTMPVYLLWSHKIRLECSMTHEPSKNSVHKLKSIWKSNHYNEILRHAWPAFYQQWLMKL